MEEVEFVDEFLREFKRQVCSVCARRGSSCSLTTKEISRCLVNKIKDVAGTSGIWEKIRFLDEEYRRSSKIFKNVGNILLEFRNLSKELSIFFQDE